LLDYLKHCSSLRRLCGWESSGEIPSEATFSREFEAFAEGELPQRIHEAMVRTQLGPKRIVSTPFWNDSSSADLKDSFSSLPP
jgi:hypothetical protein